MGHLFGIITLVVLAFAILGSLSSGRRMVSSGPRLLLIIVVLIGAAVFFIVRMNSEGNYKNESPAPSRQVQTTPDPLQNDSELKRLLSEAQQQYKVLTSERQKLDSKDTNAVRAFNKRASTYKELLVKVEQRRKALSATSQQNPSKSRGQNRPER